MVLSLHLVFLIFVLIGKITAQNYYVAVPNSLRLNSDEFIGVAADGNQGGTVNIYVQDYPGKIKNITITTDQIDPGTPKLFKVRLDTENFPYGFLSSPGFPKYVRLTAHFQGYYKELLIPINEKYGHMFIQTDKPIYTPKDRVLFRIMHLNESALPTDETFQIQIRNPNNSIVDQKLFDGKRKSELKKVSVTHVYKIPTYPVIGEWSATVQYGYNLKQNTTVHFLVQEYVLPMFTIQLETPEIILPKDEEISIKVSARYVYGKKVKGMVSFRLGIKKPTDSETKFVAIIGSRELTDGFYNLRLNVQELLEKSNIESFAEIQNSHLIVEALVTDIATGNEEEVVDSKCRFTDTPFSISFKRSLEDFRPGHTSVIEADISYANGEPAEGILTMIRANAGNGQAIEIKQDSAISDKEGKVSFEVRPQLHHNEILVTLIVVDKEYLSEASFKQHAFQSATNSYIALDRMSQTLKANDTFKRIIHYDPIGLSNIYYLVISKGRIVMMNKLPDGKYGDQHVSFKITYDMVPNFRILIFAHHDNQLLVDSLKFDVENECNPKAEVTIHPEYSIQEPGNAGKIIIRGNSKGTFVGLLGVDEAVYALSKKDILTKAKIFKRLASHDLGCGPGGGLTINDVLGKAGIILGTNVYAPSHSYSCNDRRKRWKRDLQWDIVEMYKGFEKECCSLGLESDTYGRSCKERSNAVEHYLIDEEEYINCSTIFLDCCLYKQRIELDSWRNEKMRSYMIVGKAFEDDDIGLIDIDPELEDDMERKSTRRTYFPETWIFEDLTIGPDHKEELRATLPHSITTWVIQAVSVSPTHGICIAEPKKIVSFQKIFLHLNLPYSIVRNEQVEIQATVFNYDHRPIRAVVYMYGTEGLCSSTQPGQKSERQYVTVEGQSAATVTFPVMPLKAEVIPIKVVALSSLGSDVIVRELNVVPEGITRFINIPIALDPTNLQKRKKRSIEDSYISDHIDPTQNTQATTVKLDFCLPEDFVPGTESCAISAIGDVFGPAVQTATENPEGLVQLPYGCGEQNMKWLAPTLYAMKYLKVTGKLTPHIEEKGYQYMREGYNNQLNYKKGNGAYAAFKDRAENTWLTAFVMKVFCQATELIYIDEKDICSGVEWLINNQQMDGSYIENYPLYEPKLMVGMHNKVPLTAFVLIALEECKCEPDRLNMAKLKAVAYLEDHLHRVNHPLTASIVAYALTLGNRALAQEANNNLLRMAKYDEDTNRMYWTTDDSAHDIQTAGYALLTQLLLNDMEKSASIVNWLNTKKLATGAYESTQDTMIALQAMSQYAIKARMPPINLITRISSNNNRFREIVMALNDQNAQILQDIKINKVGGTLLINTMGQGTGSLSVNVRYNVIVPPEDICKFDIQVNVTDTKYEEIIDDVRSHLNSGRDIPLTESRPSSKLKYRISICVRYLGDADAAMSIVDVGIFSGFQPVKEDLIKIEDEPSQLIQKIELSKRGVIFYLTKVPSTVKYCFHFRVLREYIVGNTQMSYIKVYDYYNPDATCTKSYRPISNSPVIRTICEGGICQCAEGGCPPRTPFADLEGMQVSERRNLLKVKFCEDFDYVWKGELHYIRKEGGFFNISFIVNEVIKAGIERKDIIESDIRTLLARDNCLAAALRYGTTYLILGKDGEGYMNEHGHIWYRYVLDQTSIIQQWASYLGDLKDAGSKLLQRDLNQVTKILKEDGCDM
uniref:Complement component 3-2 n=1 Tax=Hasarius adansoni TaxID=243517 RepID=G1UIC6_9ARAC|nr:complement component 3-2 [Hasarius adansoni]